MFAPVDASNEQYSDQYIAAGSKGFDSQPEDVVENIWPFDEAPQHLRAKAIDRLPDLIHALAATVDKTTERLKARLESAIELAAVVTSSSKKKVTP